MDKDDLWDELESACTPKAKVSLTLDTDILAWIDSFPIENRSRVINILLRAAKREYEKDHPSG
jgi:hypothetical protein